MRQVRGTKSELLALAEKARVICLLAVAVLAVLFVWQTLFAWDQKLEVRASVLVVQLLPFLLVLRGLIAGRWRSYAWMLLFLQLYFVVVSLRLFENPAGLSDWLLLLDLLLVLVSATFYVRWTRVAEVR